MCEFVDYAGGIIEPEFGICVVKGNDFFVLIITCLIVPGRIK